MRWAASATMIYRGMYSHHETICRRYGVTGARRIAAYTFGYMTESVFTDQEKIYKKLTIMIPQTFANCRRKTSVSSSD